jgi:hypothetical protein
VADSDEILAYRVNDEVSLGYFARAYEDARLAGVAWERSREKIRAEDNTSVFRVQRPTGEFLVIVVARDAASAKTAHERIVWGGTPTTLSGDEVTTIMARFREMFASGQQQSTARWGAVGGLGLGREGSQGPRRTPQG